MFYCLFLVESHKIVQISTIFINHLRNVKTCLVPFIYYAIQLYNKAHTFYQGLILSLLEIVKLILCYLNNTTLS